MQLLLLGLLVTILAVPAIAQEEGTPSAAAIELVAPVADPSAPEAPSGRVGRLSLVSGNVSVGISAETWLDGELNFPLAAGASVRTGPRGQAEIEIGADTIELFPESEIEIAKLDDLAIQVTVISGRIRFALRRLGDGECVGVDISGEKIPLLQPGHYDIDAGSRRLAVSTADARFAFNKTRFAAPYYISPNMTGFAELDAAGSWQNSAQYGAVWVPSGLPADWGPYHDGHWH